MAHLRLVLRKLGNYRAAIKDYTRELDLVRNNSQQVKCLNNRAFCFAKLEDFDQAIHDYSSVI